MSSLARCLNNLLVGGPTHEQLATDVERVLRQFSGALGDADPVEGGLVSASKIGAVRELLGSLSEQVQPGGRSAAAADERRSSVTVPSSREESLLEPEPPPGEGKGGKVSRSNSTSGGGGEGVAPMGALSEPARQKEEEEEEVAVRPPQAMDSAAEAARAQVDALKRECAELQQRSKELQEAQARVQQRNKELQEAQARAPPQQPVLKPSQQSKGEGQVSLRRVMLTRVLSPGGHKVPAASGGSSPARLAVRSPSMRPCIISPVGAAPAEEPAASPVAVAAVSIVPTEASAKALSPLASSVQAALSWITAQEQQDEPMASALTFAPSAAGDEKIRGTEELPQSKPMKRSNRFKRI